MTPRNLLAHIDKRWADRAPQRRLDRNAANVCMLLGLMLPSMSIILQGPTPSSVLQDMPTGLQIGMCACIFIGCGIKLHGALAGSRFYFPHADLKTCYRWGYTGAPMATMGSFVYGYYILSGTSTFLSALGGVSTPMFGLGIAIQAVFYWLESRRIEHTEAILIEQEIADERDANR